MFVAQNIPLQLQFNFSDSLAAIVGYVDVNIDGGPADPNLTVQAGSDLDYLDSNLSAWFDPLIRSSQRTRKGY